ncbi:MAG: hypothetical protein HC840_01350 [Leptolyngbyaceae cyanobacterium RM2_2_4]|nr:hypothetical protein [Leptolyngbyaceae cyanobacterium RM2_2_4]
MNKTTKHKGRKMPKNATVEQTSEDTKVELSEAKLRLMKLANPRYSGRSKIVTMVKSMKNDDVINIVCDLIIAGVTSGAVEDAIIAVFSLSQEIGSRFVRALPVTNDSQLRQVLTGKPGEEGAFISSAPRRVATEDSGL